MSQAALDAASRGLKVALIESQDIAAEHPPFKQVNSRWPTLSRTI